MDKNVFNIQQPMQQRNVFKKKILFFLKLLIIIKIFFSGTKKESNREKQR